MRMRVKLLSTLPFRPTASVANEAIDALSAIPWVSGCVAVADDTKTWAQVEFDSSQDPWLDDASAFILAGREFTVLEQKEIGP